MTDSTAQPGRRPTRRRLLLAASGLILALLLFVLWLKFAPPRDPDGPPDEDWCKQVRRFPPAERVRIVLDKLEELNPSFRRSTIEWHDLEVLSITESSDGLSDIRPIAALAGLKELSLAGSKPGQGKLTDLGPLKGMKLIRLNLARNPHLQDLAPLRGMPLFRLDLADTAVPSLTDLADAPLMKLNIARTAVSDLEPLRKTKRLSILDCSGCRIGSLEPLLETALEELHVDFNRDRDTAILKGIPTLQRINGVAVQQFWKRR